MKIYEKLFMFLPESSRNASDGAPDDLSASSI